MSLTIHNYYKQPRNKQHHHIDLPGLIYEQLESCSLSDQRILVPGAVDVALLRRYLQKFTGGLLPSIEPLARQLDAWLTLGLADDLTRLRLNRQERRFALAWWLKEQASRARREGPLTKNLIQEAEWLDKLLEYGRRECFDWQKINRKSISNELKATDFLNWCQQRNWVDPSQGYQLAEQVGWETVASVIEDTHLHVVRHPMMTPEQERLLEALIAHTNDRVHWHLYTCEADEPSAEAEAESRAVAGAVAVATLFDAIDTMTASEPSTKTATDVESDTKFQTEKKPVRLIQAHDRQDELEKVFRCIKSELLEAAENGEMLDLSEFVILTPDYAAYASRIPVMEHRFGLPVSVEQGPTLKGDPALAKIRTYLYLGVHDFSIDDIVDVFADQALSVPGLSITDASSPNWRTFHALCRRYNLRSLDDFDTQLERVIEREAEREQALQQRRKRQPASEPALESTSEESQANHGDFYRMMRHHLLVLRARFRQEPAPLSEWYTWALEMLDALGTVDDAALTVAIRTMRHQLQQGLGMIRRLGLDPVMPIKEVYEAMEALLDGSLAVGKHPGKILFAPLDAVYLVTGKRIYILGMTDRAYPAPRDPEQLFPGLDRDLLEEMRKARSTEADDGKALLGQLLRQSGRCWLSYPLMDGQRRAMISSVLTEAEADFPELEWHKELPPLPDGLDITDQLVKAAMSPGVHPEQEFEVKDRSKHAQLVAAIAHFRNDPEEVHLWEGQLTTTLPQWKGSVQRIVDRMWQTQLRQGSLPMSVTRFDEYAASPLAYFFSRVLRLSAPEKYNDEAEQNRKGDLLHAIFEQFYRHDARWGPPVDPRVNPEAARERIQQIAETLFAERVEDLGYPDTPYPELLRYQIRRVLDTYIDREQMGFKEFEEGVRSRVRPRSFWTSDPGAIEEGGMATEVPFAFDLEMEGYKVTIQGFIDRIDTDPEDRIRILYDYKTGGTTSLKSFLEQVNPGLSFQLPIYVSAQTRDAKRSVLAGYYHVDISKMGRTMELKYLFGNKSLTGTLKNVAKYRGLLPEETLEYFMDQIFEHRIKNIVQAIKEGRFHQSLTTPNPYSDVSRMTRYSSAIAELRHLTLLQTYPQATEVFKRYYVRRPILSTGDATSQTKEGAE